MFYIFSIIKQLIFFIIIFISFHFTFNYFRNLFLNKKGIITPNEKYEEIYQILHPSCPFTTNIKSIPKDISTNNSLSLTNNEIQTFNFLFIYMLFKQSPRRAKPCCTGE
jgi:hypothetical protein